MGCEGILNQNNLEFDSKLVDKKAQFIGKGLTIKQADKKWGWFLPDLDSAVKKITPSITVIINTSEVLKYMMMLVMFGGMKLKVLNTF